MITKRQLGSGLIAFGIAMALALLINDMLGTSEFAGIGPIQRNYYIASAIITFFGITLLPFGSKPA
ncbi:MAG: hypothetical protein ACPG8W_02835 [Candidatus Promineifilaceae bacterium]